MFKSLFNKLMGTEEQPAQTPAQPTPQAHSSFQQHDDENDADEDDDDSDAIEDQSNGSYNPETMHGNHYTEAQFEAEVERRAQDWIASNPEDEFLDADVKNLWVNYGNDLFAEWNGRERLERFRLLWGNKVLGYATFGSTKAADHADNPLLAPVHGWTLQDYCAACSKVASGVAVEDICKAMGCELPVWEENNAIWPSRMAQDSSFTVSVLFGQYFGEADQHPVLGALKAQGSATGEATLQRLKEDRYFYEELCGARQAAYEYGMDGAQWILDNYGVSLGDFQGVAMIYMQERNQNWSSDEILHFHEYQQQKQAEYAQRFANEQGGNIADDVDF